MKNHQTWKRFLCFLDHSQTTSTFEQLTKPAPNHQFGKKSRKTVIIIQKAIREMSSTSFT